jgi:autotransporter-associated beta strand protein
MYRSLAGVALFAVAALAAATAARADLSGWPSSMRIDVTGYDRDEALDNFPVLVTLSNGLQGFYYADMNSPSDGADLRFSVDGVNELNYSLDEWNTNGVSLVWVQVPALTNNLSFFAYWGASASLPAYTTNGAAWSNGYAAVWHLGETVTAGATNGLHADATANANTGTQKKNGWTNGIIGRAQNFDRTATINCGNKSSLRPTNITISAWVMPRNITYTTYLEIYRKEDGNDRHLFSFQNTGTILSFGMGAPAGDYNEQDVSISPGNYTGAWHHLVCTYNGSVKKIYRDGVEIGSAADSGSLNTAGTANGYIGSYLGTGEFFDGLIDQMEISRVGRSSNWVWASYLQVASNQSFLTYTASAGINNLPATNITTSSAWLNGYLTPGWDDDANVTVAVYWGDVDGGSPTSRLWKATNIWSQGVWAEGSYPTFQATALTADKFYYYRYAAWDAGRTNWPGSSSYFLAGQVSVSAPDSLANESGDTGTFRISRGATATNEALTVYYTIGGSAVPGTHYTLSPAGTSLVLPAGVASADITVSPLVDNTSASDTTVTLQLLPGLYALGTTNASVTISNAAVIEWMGTNGVTDAARDNFEDPANWNLGRLPTSADTVRFSSSANVSVYPDVAKSVTGDVFQFKSKSWWEIRNTKMVIGSRYEVEAGRSNFVGYSSSFDIGTRDVVINVGTGGYLQTTTTFEFKTGPGTVTFQGGGRWQLQGAASVDRVSRWTLDGSELEYWAGTANADFVLTNNGIFETWSGVAFDGVDVSGTGTVRTSSSEYSQITVASYLQPVSLSYDGDFIIDRGSIRANGAGRDVSGHNGNMVLTNGGGIVFDGGNLRVNGLKGSESTNYVYTLNTGTLIIDTTRRNGDFAGAFSTNGTLSLIKVGTGTQILSGASIRHRGTTVVSNGTLMINGTHTNGGAYTVASGGELAGTGSVSAAVTVLGSINPGVAANSEGTLTVNGNLTGAGTWNYYLGGPGNSDLLSINGNFNRGDYVTFDFGGGGVAGTYILVEWTGITDFESSDFSAQNLAGSLTAIFTVNEVDKRLEMELIDCSSPPGVTPGAIQPVNLGTTSASLPYTAPVNSPDQYEILYSVNAQTVGLFTNQPVTALPASPIPLTVHPLAPTGTYAGTLKISRGSDSCYSVYGFSVSITGALVVTWVGTNGVTDAEKDDFGDPLNWNPAQLPTIQNRVLFDTSPNRSLYPTVNRSVTGDVFQFKSQEWYGGPITWVVGSRVEVLSGLLSAYCNFDIGTRDVVFNVAPGAVRIQNAGFSNSVSVGPGAVTLQGGGTIYLNAGNVGSNWVRRWTVDGSILQYYSTANAEYVLANNGIVEFRGDWDGTVVRGTGTVKTIKSEFAQVSVNLRESSFTHDGDIVVDRGEIVKWAANRRDISGHSGNLVLTNGGRINLQSGTILRINGLKGGESTNFVYSQSGSGTLEIDTTRKDGDYAGIVYGGNAQVVNLTKLGTGTQILSGANNSYRGFTIVSNGTLLVNGTHTNGGAYTVRSGAILGGVGTIGASVTVEGSLSPGHNGIGTLSVTGGLTWVGAANATAATDWYFDLGAAPNADKVMITGNFAKSAGPAFRFNFGGSTNEGVYTLVEWTGTTGFSDGDFSYINLGNGLKAVFAIVGKTLQVTIGTCTTAPTITLGSQPDECIGATSSSLGYTATANNPTQYRIDYDDTANAAGFLDTAPAALGAAPGSLPISIPLNMPAGIYNATVYVLLPDGCFGTSAFTVTVRDVPAQPGNITQGNPSGSSVCANSVGVTYSIASVPLATSYTWSVPAGATISSGQGATQIVVDWGLAGSGNVTVYASNACGDGDPRSLAVTVRAATPNAPEAQEATDVTTSSFVANWGSVGSFDGYKMDVSTTKGFTSGFILSNETVSGNSRSFTGLSAGQPYYYRLRAFNACGASTNSATITVTLPSVLVAWDVSGLAGGAGSYGASPLAPTTVATSRLTAVGLTRGGGVSQSGTAAARGWGGTGWDGGSEAAAISAGDYATFTITPKTGNYVSIFNVNVFDYRRSADGPTSGKLQYSTNGVDFTDVGGTISYPSSDEGGDSVSSIYLGSVSGLQNVPDNVTVTFRLVNYGASAAGGDWYIYDQGASSDHDFEVLGTFCTNPAAFTVTGGGAYCSGSSGANVGLSDSEPYVTYHLYFDDGLGGGPVLVDTAFGTGGAISFGPQTGVGTYTATAERDSGGCDSSMSGSVNVTVTPTPSAPSITNTTSNASPAQVVLEWSVPGGTVTGYNVKRSSVSGGPYTLLSGGGNVQGTTFTDTTVVIGNTYYYIVTALNGACESVASVEATVVMPTGCPAGIRPIFNRRNDITVTVGNNYPYVLTATDGSSGCPSPAITNSTLPAFITTQDTTGSGTRTRTFTISPTADNQAGVYPIRVTATDAESLATTIVFNVYIGLSVESIYNGNTTPPPSQTNWHIPITDLSVPPSGNATVTFDTTVGVMYDVLTSTNPPGAGGSWSNAVAGMMADGSSEQASVVQSGSMRFYHVVPAGKSATERGVWGIVRPNIPSSLSYMSPPLPGTDRDFGGDFGAELFSELAQGTKVYVMVPGVGIDGDLDVNGDPVDTIDWIILERAQNGWERFGGGALPVLTNGQGFLVFNQGSAASPTFSGPVGNAGTNSIQIVGGSVANPGYNIIGISEGRALPASTAFDGISVVGSYDANAADQVVIYQTDGSFRRLICRPDGTWYDTGRPNNPGETDLLLMPGAAYYYIRRGGTATLEF